MRKTKTQKGIQSAIAGFALSIFATFALLYNFCAWMFLYAISGILWLAAMGWIYAEREEFREQHKKSVEISSWLFGAAAFVLVIATFYYILNTWTYLMMPQGDSLTKSDVHALYTVWIYYCYIQIGCLALLACSRAFAVYELGDKAGKRLVAVALVTMMILTVLALVRFSVAMGDIDFANEHNTTDTKLLKSKVQEQVSSVYKDNLPFLALPILSEVIFAVAYISINGRFTRGELKIKGEQEE